MKTTIEISEPLLKKTKRIMQREDTTLRALVEEGLRAVVEQRERGQEYRLRKASFKGNGLAPEFEGKGWEAMRDAVYEGHGG